MTSMCRRDGRSVISLSKALCRTSSLTQSLRSPKLCAGIFAQFRCPKHYTVPTLSLRSPKLHAGILAFTDTISEITETAWRNTNFYWHSLWDHQNCMQGYKSLLTQSLRSPKLHARIQVLTDTVSEIIKTACRDTSLHWHSLWDHQNCVQGY